MSPRSPPLISYVYLLRKPNRYRFGERPDRSAAAGIVGAVRAGRLRLSFHVSIRVWTSIAFLLAGAPYHYGTGVIGLFGLAGLAGALIAPLAGRLADHGHGRLALLIPLLATLASWALLALGNSSLPALIAGIIALDLGIQSVHINNQNAIYRLQPDARSRLTTAYMVSFFLGGVLGSLLSTTIYGTAGWTTTCLLGAAIALTALALWTVTQRAHKLTRS